MWDSVECNASIVMVVFLSSQQCQAVIVAEYVDMCDTS